MRSCSTDNSVLREYLSVVSHVPFSVESVPVLLTLDTSTLDNDHGSIPQRSLNVRPAINISSNRHFRRRPCVLSASRVSRELYTDTRYIAPHGQTFRKLSTVPLHQLSSLFLGLRHDMCVQLARRYVTLCISLLDQRCQAVREPFVRCWEGKTTPQPHACVIVPTTDSPCEPHGEVKKAARVGNDLK